jgi:hypothetical protein
VKLAIQNYEGLEAAAPNPDDPEMFTGVETPDRLAFALGWIAANVVVQRRFRRCGIDALPIYHPETGWDRFLLTRRVTSPEFKDEAANSYGMIMLDGEDAPRLTTPGGKTILSMGKGMREDPVNTLKQMLRRIPRDEIPEGKHGGRWKQRRRVYPRIFRALTETLIENPGTVAAREIFVDDKPIDGAYHPLYLHGAALEPKILYDWIMVQLGRWAVFIRTHGGQTIYETERRTWSTVKKQIGDEESYEDIKRRLEGFLRLKPEVLEEEKKKLSTARANKKKRESKRGKKQEEETEESETTEKLVNSNDEVAVAEEPASENREDSEVQNNS